MSWTISEFASIGDVTVRTLRYYDKINLLKPSDYTEGGHRLYTKDDLYVLQQIQALKHLGFSLGEVQNIILQNDIPKENFMERIHFQKELLLAEQERITKVLTHMDEMAAVLQKEETVDVPLFCSFLQTFIWEKENREWLEERGIQDIDDQELKLKSNQQFMRLIKQLKRYKKEKKDPKHPEVQVVTKQLSKLIEEIIQSTGVPQDDFKNVVKQDDIPLTEFPALLTREEEQYLKEAMKNM
ncbi:MerR family transcriptional regulator [Bacillus gaemokensis]|uniref:MerR family transcriptional regulator n=1 Tax=Bacillus gaemokensis TaxID=574375 RepID=A0A073K8I9_9BACI|nr:MerR family transcriptional regulator [Bacillus gaemokensis]KEK22851.1 MerR family transcriptional regulator [Bacillus gaemokensis]KYG30284.1 MerR family transcriptional regulator [Bacillus gaemokensis]